MKFILDANIPYSVKEIFPSTDEVVYVRDVALANASDDEIIKYALQDRIIVISRDLDFANIILHPINTHAGVVILRIPAYFEAVNIKNVLKCFLSVVDKNLLPYAVTIVEPSRYRIRRSEK